MADDPTDPTPPEAMTVQSTVMDQTRNPDLSSLTSITLRERPQSRVTARYAVIRNRNTGAFHHDSVTLETVRLRGGTETVDERHSLTLSSEDSDEIEKLMEFIAAARGGGVTQQSGRFLVMPAPEGEEDEGALQSIMAHLRTAGNYQVFAEVLSQVGRDAALLQALMERAARHPQLFAEAAAALNLVTYRNAIDRLKALIEAEDTPEQEFQTLLTEHPWMFGSEYSELLPRRRWTRDENQDFVLRCTTDGYIELIEIKRTLRGAPLFLHDTSHDSYYPRAELSQVVGQVQKYIERLDADRHSIRAVDGEDTAKIRAKIIIGRSGDENQVAALRRHNGHLERIQILTFDQLVLIAEQVVRYLDQTLHPVAQEDGDA